MGTLNIQDNEDLKVLTEADSKMDSAEGESARNTNITILIVTKEVHVQADYVQPWKILRLAHMSTRTV